MLRQESLLEIEGLSLRSQGYEDVPVGGQGIIQFEDWSIEVFSVADKGSCRAEEKFCK